MVLGAILATSSNYNSAEEKKHSDSIGARNLFRADSTSKVLDSKQEKIIQLQQDAKDSSSSIIKLNYQLRGTQDEVQNLQKQSYKYLLGGDEIPAFTASIIDNDVIFQVANPDQKFPMYNVKVKFREHLYPDIGTLYPGVSKFIDQINVQPGQEDQMYFVVWYNNTRSLDIYIKFARAPEGYLVQSTTYLNEKGIEIIPPWKRRANKYYKSKHKATQQFHPNQHF